MLRLANNGHGTWQATDAMRHTDLQREERMSTAPSAPYGDQAAGAMHQNFRATMHCGYRRLLNNWLYAEFSSGHYNKHTNTSCTQPATKTKKKIGQYTCGQPKSTASANNILVTHKQRFRARHTEHRAFAARAAPLGR